MSNSVLMLLLRGSVLGVGLPSSHSCVSVRHSLNGFIFYRSSKNELQEQWLPISNAFRWTARSSGPEMEVLPGAALQGHPVDSTALRGSRDEMLSNSKESRGGLA